ncbi:MAG: hypothetical protein ONB05_08500 [candidate division KSB1 bacterium]|nr:hypothetical protein [candidate division KSB1 bacterium]
MSTGQTLITLGALMLLSLTIFNVNKTLTHCDISLAQNRYRLEALSLLTSYIEQAALFFFYELSTDTSSEKNLQDFTLPDALGLETNDHGILDDFDDFNGYVKVDTGRSGVVYRDSFHVEYVKLQGSSIIASGNREYHKRMTIFITDAYDPPLLFKYLNGQKVRDTLKVSFVHSYWFYN